MKLDEIEKLCAEAHTWADKARLWHDFGPKLVEVAKAASWLSASDIDNEDHKSFKKYRRIVAALAALEAE